MRTRAPRTAMTMGPRPRSAQSAMRFCAAAAGKVLSASPSALVMTSAPLTMEFTPMTELMNTRNPNSQSATFCPRYELSMDLGSMSSSMFEPTSRAPSGFSKALCYASANAQTCRRSRPLCHRRHQRSVEAGRLRRTATCGAERVVRGVLADQSEAQSDAGNRGRRLSVQRQTWRQLAGGGGAAECDECGVSGEDQGDFDRGFQRRRSDVARSLSAKHAGERR